MQEANQGRSWSELVRRRLSRSIALSACLLAAVLTLVQIQFVNLNPPGDRQILEIILPPLAEPAAMPEETEPDEAQAEEAEIAEPEQPASEAEVTTNEVLARQDTPEPAADTVAPGAVVDWYAELVRVSAELAAKGAEPNSVNPHFDELRRVARIRYGKPQNDPPHPIWENVETDYLGRTILRDGDCFRIIDDPSVGNRYVFENFQQYMVYCTYQPSKPRDLPWVKEIQSRYGYLRRDNDVLVKQQEECTDCENR